MGKICAGFLIFIAFSFLIVDESWASQRISAKSEKKIMKFNFCFSIDDFEIL